MTRAINGRFAKGASGNPGGRPKELAGIRELAAQHTEAAIAALVQALNDPKTAVAAAVALLDRGWGKPQQAIELSQPDHARQVEPPDIMALIRARTTEHKPLISTAEQLSGEVGNC
ncbi:MAG: DUF5681 domain-containing protein [Alphaproteobacteria bacterium]